MIFICINTPVCVVFFLYLFVFCFDCIPRTRSKEDDFSATSPGLTALDDQ